MSKALPLAIGCAVVVTMGVGAYVLMRDQAPNGPGSTQATKPIASTAANAAAKPPAKENADSKSAVPEIAPKPKTAPSYPGDPIALLSAPEAPESSAAQAARLIASVDGKPITADHFDDLLLSTAGLRVFEQVANLIVVEQACAAAGINLNDAAFQKNIQAEMDRTFTDIGAAGLPQARRELALQQALRARGITDTAFQLGLRCSAGLRALSQGKVVITDKQVQDEFDSEYGERLHGRVFIVRTMEEAAAIRTAIVDQARDINEVAAACNAREFILPMNAQGETLEKLKQAAGLLIEKQLSGAISQPDGTYVLFYLDKKQVARTDVMFDDVAAKLRATLEDQGERAWANTELQNLRRDAKIQIKDPNLSQQNDDVIKQMKDAATPNRSQ